MSLYRFERNLLQKEWHRVEKISGVNRNRRIMFRVARVSLG